jgi:TRAP-type transport system periplasmic protein
MNWFMKTSLFGLLPAAFLFVCATGSDAADIKDRSIKLGIGLAEDHPQGMGAKKFAEIVDKKSGGKMKVKNYFSGSIGDDVKMVSALQGGVQEMTIPSTAPLTGLIKEFGVFDLPFLFNDEKEADAVLDGAFGKKMLDRLPAKGLIGLCYWENGFRQLTNSKRAVAKVEDIQGLKIRTMQNKAYIDMFNTLGANAVPMAFTELYTALETKTVDGQENPIPTIQTSKFNEVQKYLSLSKHTYSPFAVLVSKKFWDKLSGDEQKILQDACIEARDYQRKVSREANARILNELKQAGMQVSEVTPQELGKMREKVKPIVDRYTKDYGEALSQELQAEIGKVRGK